MCLKLQNQPEIPVDTIRVAHAAFPQGNVLMKLRDELGEVFTASQFADLFPAKGQPAISPGVLALVVVLQYWEGLTDRQAADAVRSRIDWKYTLGLELTDPGFDFSVLSEFRERLTTQLVANRLLEVLLEAFKARGLLKARGRQRTDSTRARSVEAVRELNRVERVGETLRFTLNTLAQVAPEWLKREIPPEWFLHYDRRFDQMHLPKTYAERDRLIEQIGRDGLDLLQRLEQPDAPEALKALACVVMMRKIWDQQYRIEEKDGQIQAFWRGSGQFPPASQLILSPYETEARFCVRSEQKWEGYRVHFTETCDEAAPLHLITPAGVETAPAPEQDDTALPRIHATLQKRNLLPEEHLVDAGYISADLLVQASREYEMDLVGPLVHADARHLASAQADRL